jgi:ABC-2 type transport system permease protein
MSTSTWVAPTVDGRKDRQTFGRVVRAEWIKQWSLRSSGITLAATLVAMVLFGVVSSLSATGSVDAAGPGGGGPLSGADDPLSTVLSGAFLGVLIVSVFGVLAGAREYGSGMVRTTMAAMPKRLHVLWAKILVLVVSLLVVAGVGVAIAYLAGNAILDSAGLATASLSQDGVVRALIGNVAYLVGLGVIGLGLGVLLRSIGGGLGLVIGGILFLPTLASALLPDSWDAILKFLPSNSAQSFTSVAVPDSLLSPGQGAAVFAAWVALAIVGAAIALRTRDV